MLKNSLHGKQNYIRQCWWFGRKTRRHVHRHGWGML